MLEVKKWLTESYEQSNNSNNNSPVSLENEGEDGPRLDPTAGLFSGWIVVGILKTSGALSDPVPIDTNEQAA